MFTTAQRNAAFDALMAYLFEQVKAQAGMFAGTVEEDLTTDVILGCVNAVLEAVEMPAIMAVAEKGIPPGTTFSGA